MSFRDGQIVNINKAIYMFSGNLCKKTPLEAWILGKIKGCMIGGQKLTRSLIEDYQLQKVKETLSLAVAKSSFYRQHWNGLDMDKFRSLQDLQKLPFVTAADIRQNPLQLLCVNQGQINRVVTLDSSGTTGLPKRIFFTAADQELTREFFHYGMSTMVSPGDKVLILLPGNLPGSVGDLLADGLRRMQVTPIPHGVVREPEEVLEIMLQEKVDCVVGIPTQVLAVARCRRDYPLCLKSVLLSTDHVPATIVSFLESTWGCRVFNHYGMTEMGLGGGVECEARSGYHLREADLLFEIVHPKSGEVLPAGEDGEVVFTTLTRQGMPLVRYRTGDLARFIPEPCTCGTVLKRMSIVRERVEGRLTLKGGGVISMSMLDEVLFPVEGLLDFKANILEEEGKETLEIKVLPASWVKEAIGDAVAQALLSIPVISENLAQGNLASIKVKEEQSTELWRPAKRVLRDYREAQ